MPATPLTSAARLSLSLWLAAVLAAAAPAQARDPQPAVASAVQVQQNQSPDLVAFNSDEGLARLARSTAKADFAALANQFEPQSNGAFCGPTTAAIVLNAVHAGSKDQPRDRSRLSEAELHYLGPSVDVTVPRYTQESVVEIGRAHV